MIFYKIVAFISGMVVLAIEITAFRIVAPFFGNSIFITTNLLAVVLAALALGYFMGGRLADKYTSSRKLFLLMLLTSFLIGLIPFVGPPLFGWLRTLISGLDWTLVALSLIGSLLIFFVPFVFLGLVSPWLIRLSNQKVKTTGRAAGSIYAWSTLGSLLGTFIPTWVSVPFLGSKRTFLIFAALLALVAAIGLVKKRWWLPGLTLLILTGLISPNYFAGHPGVLAEAESPVEYLRVEKDNKYGVILRQDEGIGIHSVYKKGSFLTGQYFDWVMLTPLLNGSAERSQDKGSLNIGILGLAGGTLARGFEHFYGPSVKQTVSKQNNKKLKMWGVELDAATLSLAHKYFGMTQQSVPDLTQEVGDARIWLNKQKTSFDVLVLDTFRQLYIPAHLSSREFFKEAQEKLTPQGVLVVNLDVTNKDSLVYQKVLATLQSVFEQVLVLQVPESFNVVFFAADHELSPDVFIFSDQSINPELQELARQFAQVTIKPEQLQPATLIATDDRPLVESFFDGMLVKYLLNLDATPDYL